MITRPIRRGPPVDDPELAMLCEEFKDEIPLHDPIPLLRLASALADEHPWLLTEAGIGEMVYDAVEVLLDMLDGARPERPLTWHLHRVALRGAFAQAARATDRGEPHEEESEPELDSSAELIPVARSAELPTTLAEAGNTLLPAHSSREVTEGQRHLAAAIVTRLSMPEPFALQELRLRAPLRVDSAEERLLAAHISAHLPIARDEILTFLAANIHHINLRKTTLGELISSDTLVLHFLKRELDHPEETLARLRERPAGPKLKRFIRHETAQNASFLPQLLALIPSTPSDAVRGVLLGYGISLADMIGVYLDNGMSPTPLIAALKGSAFYQGVLHRALKYRIAKLGANHPESIRTLVASFPTLIESQLDAQGWHDTDGLAPLAGAITLTAAIERAELPPLLRLRALARIGTPACADAFERVLRQLTPEDNQRGLAELADMLEWVPARVWFDFVCEVERLHHDNRVDDLDTSQRLNAFLQFNRAARRRLVDLFSTSFPFARANFAQLVLRDRSDLIPRIMREEDDEYVVRVLYLIGTRESFDAMMERLPPGTSEWGEYFGLAPRWIEFALKGRCFATTRVVQSLTVHQWGSYRDKLTPAIARYLLDVLPDENAWRRYTRNAYNLEHYVEVRKTCVRVLFSAGWMTASEALERVALVRSRRTGELVRLDLSDLNDTRVTEILINLLSGLGDPEQRRFVEELAMTEEARSVIDRMLASPLPETFTQSWRRAAQEKNVALLTDWALFHDCCARHRPIAPNPVAALHEQDLEHCATGIAEQFWTLTSEQPRWAAGLAGAMLIGLRAQRTRRVCEIAHQTYGPQSCDIIRDALADGWPSGPRILAALQTVGASPEHAQNLHDRINDEILPGLLREALMRWFIDTNRGWSTARTPETPPSIIIHAVVTAYDDQPSVLSRALVRVLQDGMHERMQGWAKNRIRGAIYALGHLRETYGNRVPKLLVTLSSFDDLDPQLAACARDRKRLFDRTALQKGQHRAPRRRMAEGYQALIRSDRHLSATLP